MSRVGGENYVWQHLYDVMVETRSRGAVEGKQTLGRVSPSRDEVYGVFVVLLRTRSLVRILAFQQHPGFLMACLPSVFLSDESSNG